MDERCLMARGRESCPRRYVANHEPMPGARNRLVSPRYGKVCLAGLGPDSRESLLASARSRADSLSSARAIPPAWPFFEAIPTAVRFGQPVAALRPVPDRFLSRYYPHHSAPPSIALRLPGQVSKRTCRPPHYRVLDLAFGPIRLYLQVQADCLLCSREPSYWCTAGLTIESQMA
jgi:hypothetical protein